MMATLAQGVRNGGSLVKSAVAAELAKARALLDRLGLDAEAQDNRSASELSVGQQQRVAAARALIGSPSLVIADEPTSALDSNARQAFIDTLLTEAKDAAVLFVSHDPSLSSHFDRLTSMDDINALSTTPAQARPVDRAAAEA
ncbi:MAG: ATP-binding cassette domain-containing protein, partial [Pseudomonadota bacterium]